VILIHLLACVYVLACRFCPVGVIVAPKPWPAPVQIDTYANGLWDRDVYGNGAILPDYPIESVLARDMTTVSITAKIS